MSIEVARDYSTIMRKFGMAGFAFFLVKGLLWLIAPFVFVWFI